MVGYNKIVVKTVRLFFFVHMMWYVVQEKAVGLGMTSKQMEKSRCVGSGLRLLGLSGRLKACPCYRGADLDASSVWAGYRFSASGESERDARE